MNTNKLTSDTKNRKKLALLLLILIIIVVGIGAKLYNNQHKIVHNLLNQNNVLNSQLKTLNSQLVSVKSATNISTTNWKSFCDPYRSIFCFKYPANWTVVENNYSPFRSANVTITNPAKTIQLLYENPWNQDTFPTNFIVHSASNLNVSNIKLILLAGYYVGAVEHKPFYEITNPPINHRQPGQNIIRPRAPAFTYENGNQVSQVALMMISPINQNFNTTKQANAWFNSINGKIALKIMQSF